MKITIEIPDTNMIGDIWEENFKVQTEVISNKSGYTQILLGMNKAGLISLAKLFFHLAFVDQRPGTHYHFDESNLLESGSKEIIIMKIE